jgi:adenine-specific DNA-methyltransferase
MIEVTGYPTEKPLAMLRRIVSASSDRGDLVLDCFAGSGTTLVAAEELGRRWIGVDSGVEAIATTVKRLAQGSEPMGDFVQGKKAKVATLFDHPSALQTSFDLYLADGPTCIPADLLEQWAQLFPSDSACILR